MKRILSDLWFGEPALVLALIEGALIFGVSIVGNFSMEQSLALYGIVRAVSLFYTRRNVTPV